MTRNTRKAAIPQAQEPVTTIHMKRANSRYLSQGPQPLPMMRACPTTGATSAAWQASADRLRTTMRAVTTRRGSTARQAVPP